MFQYQHKDYKCHALVENIKCHALGEIERLTLSLPIDNILPQYLRVVPERGSRRQVSGLVVLLLYCNMCYAISYSCCGQLRVL